MGEQRMEEINNGNNIAKFPIFFVNLKTEEINNGKNLTKFLVCNFCKLL